MKKHRIHRHDRRTPAMTALGVLIIALTWSQGLQADQETPPQPPPIEETPPAPRPPSPPPAEPESKPEVELPDGRSIVVASLAALGGKEKAQETESFTATATLDAPVGGQIVLSVKSTRTGKFFLDQRVTEIPDSESVVVSDSKHCWIRTPQGEFVVVDQSQGKREFSILFPHWFVINPEGSSTSFQTVDLTSYHDVDCHKVRMSSEGEDDLQRYAFFDAQTNRIQGLVLVQTTQIGDVTVDFQFGEWKEFDGRHIFTKMTVDRGGERVEVHYSDIAFNTVDAGVFEQPAEVQELIKKKEEAEATPEPSPEVPPSTPPPATPPATPPSSPPQPPQ